MGDISQTVTNSGLTFIKSENGKELAVNENGYLIFGGGGNTSDCSVKFSVTGDCTINIWSRSRSSEEERTLKLFDEKSIIAEFVSPTGTMSKGTYEYTGGAKDLYLASKASGIYVYAIEILYVNDEEADKVFYADDFKTLKSSLYKAGLYEGGTVIINADTIICNSSITLDNVENAEITLCGGEGYRAILDFSEYRDKFEEDDMYAGPGLVIMGNNYTVRDIIVENCPGSGVRIGNGAGNNRLENIVSRYNGGSGYGVENCYAYRNCDVVTKGENADGFWVAFYAGTGNRLINCYSWENADDGFDSFNMFNDVYYENCFAWRNGIADVFSGKFDFDRGRKLDEKQPLVRRICEYDPTFKEKYENGIFELPEGEFLLTTPISETVFTYISASDFVGDEWRGNSNGIKMGSGSSATIERPQVGPEAVRTMINCITFEHNSKGFDRNNANCTVYIKNGLSFENKARDFWLDTCMINQFENVYGPFSTKNRLPEGYEITELSSVKLTEAKAYLYDRIDVLEGFVYNDEIPHDVGFERVFGILN